VHVTTDTTAFASRAQDVQVHETGWADHPTDPTWEVTKLPLVDVAAQIFARPDYDALLEVAAREGAELLTEADSDAIHVSAFRLVVSDAAGHFFLVQRETREEVEQRVREGLDLNHSLRLMGTRAWCDRQDTEIWRQLREGKWDGHSLVSNCGKDWIQPAPAGLAANYGLYDPHAPNHRIWQTRGTAHNRKHTDYSQLGRLKRRKDPALRGKPSTSPLAASTPPPTGTRATIRRGSSGPDVEAWQRVIGATADGIFGPGTEAKTKAWQAAHGLTADGIVGPASWAASSSAISSPTTSPTAAKAPAIPSGSAPSPSVLFVPARGFTRGRLEPITLIVMHDMEAAKTLKTAENVAAWFGGPAAPKASAHYCCDADSIVQSVRDEDTAWAAPGANANGLHFELAGFARETREEWLDEYGIAMLERAAALVARKCQAYGIPIELVDAEGIVAGRRGITTHAEVTKAMRTIGGHQDPGPGFPMDRFLEMVRAASAA
jgi:N-acetyl-anhydromuramyl-L-alanine amidase AmpD